MLWQFGIAHAPLKEPCASAIASKSTLLLSFGNTSKMITLSPALKFLPQIRKRDCARSASELHIQITGFEVPADVDVRVGVPNTVVPEVGMTVFVDLTACVAVG